MNKLILIILSLITQLIFSQKINDYDSPTTNHNLIEGTKINIIPPKDFIKSSDFIGFQNPNKKSSVIMIIEIPGPFNDITKGFNKKTLDGRGMKLISKKKFNIKQYNGLLVNLEQSANGLLYSKYILIYGNKKSTTMVIGVFLKNAINDALLIKESINSIVIDDNRKVNLNAAIDFTVNENIGNLISVNIGSNVLMLNRDGKIPTKSDDKTSLIINKSFLNLKINDKKSFCISRLESFPYKYVLSNKHKVSKIEINNLNGFELFAKSPKYKDELLYQVILFNDDGGYYIFVGTYIEQNKKALLDIKKIISSFNTTS